MITITPRVLTLSNKTSTLKDYEQRKTKQVLWLCLIKNIEDFLLQVTRGFCISLALIAPDRSLSTFAFANLLKTH